MSLRRGFKAEAERIATEVRDELSLSATCRLDPLDLARHLAIPVFTIHECLGASQNTALLKCLLRDEAESFSAITLFIGSRRVIVHNESHASTRRANNIVHEVAHSLLEHPAGPVTDHRGCRFWNETLEDEANWLAGALLVPREGALTLALSGFTLLGIAGHFGVSEQLCRWRINQTGVAHQLRARSRWALRSC